MFFDDARKHTGGIIGMMGLPKSKPGPTPGGIPAPDEETSPLHAAMGEFIDAVHAKDHVAASDAFRACVACHDGDAYEEGGE